MDEGVTMGRVEGKVALVTGAAKGQGRSHCVRLAEEGADVIALDFLQDYPQGRALYTGGSEADLAETVRLVEATGRKIVTHRADVQDLAQLQQAVDDGVAALGRLDIVSANAGVLLRFGKVEELDEDDWLYTLNTNLSGVWRTIKTTVPHLKASGGGSIIVTSSAAGIKATANAAAYVASKFGVIGLARSAARELGAHNIRVNLLHPTQVATDMILNQNMYDLFCPDIENPTQDDFAARSSGMMAIETPWIDPVDVSNALVYLASDEARFVTGASVPVDSGQLLN
jgi:(+)-trans-carveol dehydrogenase